MSAAPASPRVLSAVPGRVRVHWPGWFAAGEPDLEVVLRAVPGSLCVRTNRLTGNVLVELEPGPSDSELVLDAVRRLDEELDPPEDPPVRRPAGSRPERARPTGATGMTTVGLDHLPGRPPEHAEVLDAAARLLGAALGLTFLGARRLTRRPGLLPAATTAALLATAGAVVEGFPAVRHAARRRFGPGVADVAFAGTGTILLTLASSPIGLGVAALFTLRELTEVRRRRAGWLRYLERLHDLPATRPGERIRLSEGERTPLSASVLEGTGTAIGPAGVPVPVRAGCTVSAGSRLLGDSFRLELAPQPAPRPVPGAGEEGATSVERYAALLDLIALLAAGAVIVVARSPVRALAALLVLSPRPALDGVEAADRSASARILREGATVVDVRRRNAIRRPDVLLVDGARPLADGLEVDSALSLGDAGEDAQVLEVAVAVAAAAGWPWGRVGTEPPGTHALSGSYDGHTARATLHGTTYSLRPADASDHWDEIDEIRERGGWPLVLQRGEGAPIGLVSLRPRIASRTGSLVDACNRNGVRVELVPPRESVEAAAAVAKRVGFELTGERDPLEAVLARRAEGKVVAFVTDSPESAEALAAADLAVGLSAGRTRGFPARVDVLAPDLGVVAAAVEAGCQRDRAARDSLVVSAAANAIGAFALVRLRPELRMVSLPENVARLIALGSGWARLRGGQPLRSSVARLVDPRPERWGRGDVASVLRALDAREQGLTTAEAAARMRRAPKAGQANPFLVAVAEQLASPLTGALAVGAGLSLVMGSAADVLLIAAVIGLNATIGAVQEAQVSRAATELERLSDATATVLRDGRRVRLPVSEIVRGDVLLLSHGERVAADARLLTSYGLEIDEAALTGESLPVPKLADGPTPASRVVLEGSDVAVGHGRAVAFAVGRGTRLGAIAAALASIESEQTPLGTRLNRMLLEVLPVAVGGGALVVLSGLLWRRPLLAQLALGASTTIAAVPEGLPLLAGIGQAAVSRRLARRNALVRRPSAVEALGRVDVACIDKTGTLTEGRLTLQLVADTAGDEREPGDLTPDLTAVLLVAALASPRPDSSAAAAHSTDVAVLEGARRAGLAGELNAERGSEAPFDPARPFHATLVGGRLCVKGSAETLVPRCDRMRVRGADETLDAAARTRLLRRDEELAAQGLRVLFVAEGPADGSATKPQGLVALGFLGIRDSLRPGVAQAVARCRDAGIRLIMLTGDHPETARTIAREIDLIADGGEIVSGQEIAELDDDELDRRLGTAAVIARISPLEKLRVVESLKRGGHTVAMTGDGVNDAPALRLADVGIAMGRGGTEVARQAADIVIADDNFATIVEALIEGRAFWWNTRRALGMLLGGNLGELVFIGAVSVAGLPASLTTRQVLAVNLGSDVLPALSLAVQEPGRRNLQEHAREGTASLGAPLRRDIARRAVATSLPALAAYLTALGSLDAAGAQAVGFGSIIVTQVAQALDTGLAEQRDRVPVIGAAASSTGLLAAAFVLPGPRRFLGLAPLSPLGWLLIGLSAPAAVALGRGLATLERPTERAALPAPSPARA